VRVSVSGCGRRGVLHAACLAAAGHEVVLHDTDPRALDALRTGPVGAAEPRLHRLLALGLVSGRLRPTTDRTAVAGARVHVLCVGAGPDPDPDGVSRVVTLRDALDDLAPHLGPGDLVVGRARVPAGTAEWLAATLLADGVRATVAWVPDEHRPGHAVVDLLHPVRLVHGVPDGPAGERAAAILDALHAVQLATDAPRTVTDLATAEGLGHGAGTPRLAALDGLREGRRDDADVASSTPVAALAAVGAA
jgi:UDPglucose 6-dehydrogenase